MEIIYRNLSDLKPNPKNPRIADNPNAIKELAESIKGNPKFFEARPILLSNRTGELVIIGGERRKEAAELLGMVEAPTILMEGLNEEQEEEILIKDNTHAGKWDERKLRDLKSKWGDRIDDWIKDRKKVAKTEWKEKSDAEIKFSEVLNEEHNYLVLYFDNSVDWLQVLTLLGLESVKAYSTRKDGKITKGNQRIGVGRVLKGAEVLEKLKKILEK